MSQNSNPLKQYFRQPTVYLRLPSEGNFWAAGAVDMPPNKELPVLPMTALDEITYRTPDALFNGSAVVNVIQSCVPNIRDAWSTPGTDLNSILVAIRIASYGHGMEINSACPKCNNEDEYSIDLRVVLDNLQMPDYMTPLKEGDLEISFQPMAYRDQNDTNMKQFEEQRILQSVPNSDLPDEQKLEMLNQALKKITELTVSTLKWNIASIRTPHVLVTDPTHIEEFLRNTDRKLFVKIRDLIIEKRNVSEFKPVQIKCGACGHEYKQAVTLDQTSFFDQAS
jgi:bacterioferritin-associated ferredoxin